MNIGVLALQGAFIEHIHMLRKLGVDCFEIRQKKDLEQDMDGLIIPGGESTVMGKLMNELGMMGDIKSKIDSGLPAFGTCAGLILLAKSICNDENKYLCAMDITARRNAYGRQLGSFRTTAQFGGEGEIPMTFIRAPYIENAGDGVEILSRVDEKIVAARQKNCLVTSFHPELDSDTGVHEYFLSMIDEK